MKTFSQLVIVALSALFFSSCGSDAPKEVVADTVVEETIKNWEEFTISAVGNTMQDMMYSEKNLNVKEGSWVRIILKNEGVDQAMIHNILFVNFGQFRGPGHLSTSLFVHLF